MSDKDDKEYIKLCEQCINNVKSIIYSNKLSNFAKIKKIKDIIKQFNNVK